MWRSEFPRSAGRTRAVVVVVLTLAAIVVTTLRVRRDETSAVAG